MSQPTTFVPTYRAASVASAPPRATLSSPVARAVLAQGLLTGIAGDALLRDTGAGLAFPLFIATLAIGVVALAWRAGRAVNREAAAWLWTAVLFAALLSWRDSAILHLLDVLAILGAFAMSAVALGTPGAGLLAPRLRDTVLAAREAIRTAVPGVLPLVSQELLAQHDGEGLARRGRPALRAAVIAAVVLMPFGALLRDADPIFASLVALPDIDAGEVISHLFLITLIAWIIGGWARVALPTDGARRAAPDAFPFTLGLLDVTTALAALDTLFALYVLSQLGWFFGGEQFLRERTGLTAAEYARGGFFQMVVVVMLVVPLLLATRAALSPRDARLTRRHTMLALPMIGLLGAMIVSAVLRMRLYVHYFGVSTDRVYTLVFMGCLAFVLAWLALTVLRGRGRWFVAGAVTAAALVLSGLHIVSVDVIVARAQIARAAASRDGGILLDRTYLTRLSGEAAELATAATLAPVRASVDDTALAGLRADRCLAATNLLARWGTSSPAARQRDEDAAWRYWNAGKAHALRVVRANTAALLAIRGTACKPGRTSSAPVSVISVAVQR